MKNEIKLGYYKNTLYSSILESLCIYKVTNIDSYSEIVTMHYVVMLGTIIDPILLSSAEHKLTFLDMKNDIYLGNSFKWVKLLYL